LEDTTEINKNRLDLDLKQSIWLFGYGSLIFKADFPYMERKPAGIQGWIRRFWQGSHDHRGTPDSPGRAVTLIESENEVCYGVAYKIKINTLEKLDYREKNGYLRFFADLRFEDGEYDQGLVYIATPQNGAFLGKASEKDIAKLILVASGASGTNLEYFKNLYFALDEMNALDSHMLRINSYIEETLKFRGFLNNRL